MDSSTRDEQLVAENGYRNKRRGLRAKFTKIVNENNRVIEEGDREQMQDTKERLDATLEDAIDFVQQVSEDNIVSNEFKTAIHSWIDIMEAERDVIAKAVLQKLHAKREPSQELPQEMPLAASSNATPPSNSASLCHLERLPLKRFSGEKGDNYFEWRTNFDVCVNSQPIDEPTKMLRLKSCLSGSAAALVQGLRESKIGYEAAMSRLEREFGGKSRLLNQTLKSIRETKFVFSNDARGLKEFRNLVNITVINLTDMGFKEELGNGMLLNILKSKVDTKILEGFERYTRIPGNVTNVLSFCEFIDEECDIIATLSETLGRSFIEKRVTHNVVTSNINCVLCGENHEISNCERFKKLSVPERYDAVYNHKLCFLCLSNRHRIADCKSVNYCTVNNCGLKHNFLLHKNGKFVKSNSHMSCTDYSKVMLRTIPVRLTNGCKSVTVKAFLDDGSTASYISDKVAQQLGIDGATRLMKCNTIGGKNSTVYSKLVSFQICGLHPNAAKKTMSAFTIRKVSLYSEPVDVNTIKDKYKHLRDIDFPYDNFSKNDEIQLLIGSDQCELHTSIEERYGETNEPTARKTILGWTCLGPVKNVDTRIANNYVAHVSFDYDELEKLVDNLWSMEKYGIQNDRKECKISKYPEMKRFFCKVNSRFEASIPWKDGEPEFSNNFTMASKRLTQTISKLKSHTNALDDYRSIIEDYEAKGYIKRVNFTMHEQQWFLPHFAVIRPEKITTKTRIVFDAAGKHNGKCLNDAIEPGPKLQNEIADVMLRHRRLKIGISGDVSEMFLQVSMSPKDRPFHRFLWANDLCDNKRNVFEFQRLVFGNCASPFLAQYAVLLQASEMKETHPEAYESITKAIVMDDVCDSREGIKEVLELTQQLSEVFSAMGMQMRKWLSNSNDVLKSLNINDISPCIKTFEETCLPSLKILGVTWNTYNDTLSFPNGSVEELKLTRRNLLKIVARVYDPLQLLAPYLIRGRIILQLLWLSTKQWDEECKDPKIVKDFINWYKEISTLSKFTLPRWIGLDLSNMSELHVFCDASINAYAAVVYARIKKNDTYVVNLICAKTRVAPLKSISIPRLELCAAVLGVKFGSHVSIVLEVDKVHFWSDSKNVLCWISKPSRCFQSFVAHRVGLIQDMTSVKQWHYVNTKNNPADLPTRGNSISELEESKLWKNGPEFLLADESHWSESNFARDSFKEDKTELKKSNNLMQSLAHHVHLELPKFSSYTKLTRVMAWIFKYVEILRQRSAGKQVLGVPTKRTECGVLTSCQRQGIQKPHKLYDLYVDLARAARHKRLSTTLPTVDLSVDMIIKAEKFLIVKCQHDCFEREIQSLKREGRCPRNSNIISLRPFLDEDNVLRSNGRLSSSLVLDRNSKQPIILPKKHETVTLIINKIHKDSGHVCGVNHTWALLCKRYWIVRGREAVRKVLYNCIQCKRFNARESPQLMAPLPLIRSDGVTRAFDAVGLDFAGPILVKRGRGQSREKRYLCLFTCIHCRAVHLEVCWNLTSDSFILAFDRFTNRRGVPSYIVSDNGTNFIGAEKEIESLFSIENKNKIDSYFVKKKIKWHFNPPGSPHFGGIFESLIKSAKSALFKTLKSSLFFEEELITAVTSVEGLLNSRPIAYKSSDIRDELVLTPNNFLMGLAPCQLPIVSDGTSGSLFARWWHVQQTINHFWKRWHLEILPSLTPRRKWNSKVREISRGDVVVIVEKDTPRGSWPLGKVEEVEKSVDGIPRTVIVASKQKLRRVGVHRVFHLLSSNELSNELGSSMVGSGEQNNQ